MQHISRAVQATLGELVLPSLVSTPLPCQAPPRFHPPPHPRHPPPLPWHCVQKPTPCGTRRVACRGAYPWPTGPLFQGM